MSDTRRMFVKQALAASGAVFSWTYLYPIASAAGCKAETRILGFGAALIDGASIYSVGIPEWKLGDCELRNVVIDFPGGGIGNFRGEVGTHFTHHKDVWHFRLELFTGNPSISSDQVVLFDQAWDGPQMSELDKPLFHPWQFQFSISPAIGLGKVIGRATSCC